MRAVLVVLVFCSFLFSCNVHNSVKNDEGIQKIYDSLGLQGSFGMLNNVNGILTISNKDMFTQRFSPASTSKILTSLIALHTGVLANDSSILKWDGVKRKDIWDKDMTLHEAFKLSNEGYFKDLAKRLGTDTMQRWIDSIGYGNKNIKGNIEDFWINDSLKISCDEQLHFVKKLFFKQLPFNNRAQEKVQQIMLWQTDTVNNYTLSYKTGWNPLPKQNLGWIVGWVVKERQPYFFVQLLKTADSTFQYKNNDNDIRVNLAKKILAKLDVIPQ